MLPSGEGGEGIAPETVAMVRMIGGALFFQALELSFSRRARDARTVDRPGEGRDAADPSGAEKSRLPWSIHARLAGFALLGVAVNQALFLTGLRLSTPFAVSLLGATIPVLAAALAIVSRREPASWRTGGGLALALAGVLWLIGVGPGGRTFSLDVGAVLVALNSLSYAAYVVFSRRLVIELGSVRFIAWVFTYGALFFAPVGMPALAAGIGGISARGGLLLAYIVVFPTLLAYGLNAWALARTSPSMVTIYIYLQPLIAALLARVQLGQGVSPRAGTSALLILGGVAVATLKRAPPK